MRDAPRHRDRPARASATSPMPRGEDHDLRLRPWLDALLLRARHRGRRGGRQLDGRLHRRRDGDQVPAPRRAARARRAPPGCRSSTSATTRILRALEVDREHRAVPHGALLWRGPTRCAPAARAQRASCGSSPRTPSELDPRARRRAAAGREQAGLRAGARRADRLSDPRPARRTSTCPTLDRLGRRRTCSSRSRTPTSSSG